MLFEQPFASSPRMSAVSRGSPYPGEMVVETSGVPFDVSPGGSFPLTVALRYDATSTSFLVDPDQCTASNLGTGIRVRVEVTLNGRPMATGEKCVPTNDPVLGEREDREVVESISVPEAPGTYELVTVVRGANSGDIFTRVTEDLDVTTAATGGGSGGGRGGYPSCPDNFALDPETGECVEVGEQNNNNENNNNDDEKNSDCTFNDALDPTSDCTFADVVGAGRAAAGGAFLVMFLLALAAVSA